LEASVKRFVLKKPQEESKEYNLRDKNRLYIDPGISGTGFAFFSKENKTFVPDFNLSFHKPSLLKYYEFYQEFIDRYEVEFVMIERPQFFGLDSTKGLMVAVKGDLITLTMLAGGYEGIAILNGCEVETIEVNKWKGQLPKEVIKERIRRVWKEVSCKNHDWDAVGIAYYDFGIL
jgi:Holliday junction resolvasome RuvABC endonuclease subunit